MHFALFVTKLFSFRHKGTKTPKNNNKILRVFVTLWQIFGPSALRRLA